MSRQKCFDSIPRLLLLFAIVLIFAVSASAEWKEKVLYSFQGLPDGAYPAGSVVFDQAGNLYGATTYGGANNCPGVGECGTVYQLQPPLQKGKPWREKTLYIFKGANHNDGSSPSGGVLMDQAGNLYGTNAYGGTGKCQLFGSRTGCGTIYELIPPKQKNGAWTEKVLYSFQGGKDGQFPWGDLTFDSAGNLYGATQYGGGKGTSCDAFYQFCGTVFMLSPPKTKSGNWTEKVLHSFAGGSDGANPNGGLVLDSNGVIYGTTFYGGVANCSSDAGTGCGIVFELEPPQAGGGPWIEKILHRFQGGTKDTNTPDAGLVLDGNGNLYGTTYGGYNSGGDDGSVFELRPPLKRGGAWKESLLVQFQTCSPQYGCSPSGLTADSVGDLYIRTGVIFRMKRPVRKGGRWTLSLIYKFKNSPDGYDPIGLVFGGTGAIYGATLNGGTGHACQGGCGTVFEVWP